jgi:hypothetical protein
MTNAIELFDTAEKAVRNLDIPSREVVQALAKSAMRMVAIELADGNPRGALDTLDKMDAIETYIKAKVRQEHADVITQNIIAANRFRIRWEIGKWLDKHIVRDGSRPTDFSEKPVDKYWIEDVFGNNGCSAGMKAYYWQALYRAFPEPNQLDEYLKPWESPDNKTADELMWKHVWSVANPPKPKAEPAPLEVELTPAGEKFYRAIETWRNDAENYLKYLYTHDVPMREALFIAGTLRNFGGDLMGVIVELESGNEPSQQG